MKKHKVDVSNESSITLIFLSFRLTAFLDLFHKPNNIIALENKFKVANTNLLPQNIVDTM